MRGAHENTGLKGKTPSTREAQDEKCCCERMRVEEKLSAAKTERKGEQGRETPSGQAAGLSHFPEELEEVIAVDVCNTSRQRRGRQQGDGRVLAAQDQVLPMYQQQTLVPHPAFPGATLPLRY